MGCDGSVDANCDTCINAVVGHNKLLGDMTCKNLYTKLVHTCMLDDLHIECGKGQTIEILDASYGRFAGGGATCATSPMPNLYSGGHVWAGGGWQRGAGCGYALRGQEQLLVRRGRQDAWGSGGLRDHFQVRGGSLRVRRVVRRLRRCPPPRARILLAYTCSRLAGMR